MEKHNLDAFSRLFEVSVPHVLCSIFLDLDVADVANCRCVCKAWKSFIDAHILANEANLLAVKNRSLHRLWSGGGDLKENWLTGRFGAVIRGAVVDDLKWDELEVEQIGVRGDDIFLLTKTNTGEGYAIRVIVFTRLRQRCTIDLPHGKFDGDMFLGKKIFMEIADGQEGGTPKQSQTTQVHDQMSHPVRQGLTSRNYPILLAVFHYPQQRAFVYDRSSLKLIKAEVKFPKLTKSDYIRVIGGRIHLLAAAMIAEGREDGLPWHNTRWEVRISVVSDTTGELEEKEAFTTDSELPVLCANTRYLMAAGKCGRAELFARESGVDAGRRLWSVAFDSESNDDEERPKAGAWIKSVVLARHFCGVKFSHMIDDESREGPVNVVLFDNLSGQRIFHLDDIKAYGTTYFSASDRYFVFTHLDGNLTQHFAVFDYKTRTIGRIVPGSAQSSKYEGRHRAGNAKPQLSAPYLLRSMQIIADGLLLVSFYRTASQLSLFNLSAAVESGDVSGEEREMRLPSGVIPFQTQSDVGLNTQKLVMFREAGILCQKQSSGEKVIYSVKDFHSEDVSAEGCAII